MNRIYENGGEHDAEALAFRLHGLCKIGAAASDTVLHIDLSKGGMTELFEVMAGVCDELLEALEQEKKAQRQAVKAA